MNIFSKNWVGGNGPFAPPGYAYAVVHGVFVVF